jgi:hypothetical protein
MRISDSFVDRWGWSGVLGRCSRTLNRSVRSVVSSRRPTRLRDKGRSPESSPTFAPTRFPAGAMAERWAAGYSTHVPSPAATWEAGKPINLALDCLQVSRVDRPLGAACASPRHDQSCVDPGAMARTPLGGPTPRSSALSTSGRPRCPAGRVANVRSRAPLRARRGRSDPSEPGRKRSANGVQTHPKRSANGSG